MTVLVLNCGSSSVKWALVDPAGRGHVAKGQVERIGTDIPDHDTALGYVAEDVLRRLDGEAPVVIGHRVVHGGDLYTEPVTVTDAVLADIERLSVLAPLHNPANAQGIRSARAGFPGVDQVAVFDTAFHATVPVAHRTYAVPRAWERDHGVRRYGFHGTSHSFVSRSAGGWLAEHRGVDPHAARVVVLHLGNGASACAVLGGVSIDTSMGMTPLPGLVMGTRSGDVDPAVFGHLWRVAGLDADHVERALNKDGGLKGICGDSDMRQVEARAKNGDESAVLALEVYAHRVRSYLGAYAVTLGGLDAIAFTAGVGENSPYVRSKVLDGMQALGVVLDGTRNASIAGGVRPITADTSPVAVLVVPTDEEWEIATLALGVVRS